MEPEPGKLNTEFLAKVLKETHESGQKLAFRVMCCSTTLNAPYHPKWLKEIGGRELVADYEGHGPFLVPDMDDPIVLKAHLDFIKRLGQRYDGYRLSNDNGFSKVIVGSVTVNRWLPGSIDLFTPEFFTMPKDLPPGEINAVADTIPLADIPPGKYALSVGIVDEPSAPVVRLGIKGRGDDGWYSLSKVQVVK